MDKSFVIDELRRITPLSRRTVTRALDAWTSIGLSLDGAKAQILKCLNANLDPIETALLAKVVISAYERVSNDGGHR